MAESAVALLLKELSIFLHGQISQLGGGLQRDVQFIRDELDSMRAFVRDAEAKEDDVSELRVWISQVRDVAYDTEDVLDEFIMRFSRHHPDGFYGRVHKTYCSIKNIKARREISSKIKDIKSRVEEISARHQRYQSVYGLSERGSCSAAAENIESQIRGNALLLEEADLVGIEEPKRELISQILDGNPNLKVVSVVGMGGLGKTTLVKRVYEDANVNRHFQIHAWLTISQTFHMKAVLKDLIQKLNHEIKEPVPQHVESMDDDHLRSFVKDFLREKRFIVVLDDLWKLESWEALKFAFPLANCGSRIILTTRIMDTALGSCRESNVHKMQPLSDEESWTLFCRKTFGDSCCPPYLEDVSKRILRKCEGLPLAIISIGGVLALKQKSKLDEWEMILRSLGGEMEGTGKLEIVKKILFLSYSDLPVFLKNCLMYISIYPEDCTINAATIIQLWIMEGFIQEREGMTTTEVGRGYLNELVNRSLIQVAELDTHGDILYCHIHDILREIIVTKSREQNFATVVNLSGDQNTRLSGNIRRLAIHGFIENRHEYNCFRHLRSLVIFGYTNPLFDSSLSKLLSGVPKLLKVLDCEGAQQLTRIPKEVFKLFYLRYLNLKGTGVQIIPQSIGKLQNLEYLNLADTKVMELPSGILKLRKLRELYVYEIDKYSENYAAHGFKAPREFGNLLSLQVLGYIDADNEIVVKEIGKLTQLRMLGITKLRREDGKELCSTLRNLTNLHTLSINAGEGHILDLQHPMSLIPQVLQVLALCGRLEKVPQWVPFLQGLTTIKLHASGLREDPLEFLQDLPNLMLIVLSNAYEGEELCFKVGGFQKLKKLFLFKLQQLKQVRMQDDALPCLQRLEMADCKLMDKLPWGIQKLNKLQHLGLRDMSNELIMQLRNQGSEEYRKVAQVPEIKIFNWIDGKWEQCLL